MVDSASNPEDIGNLFAETFKNLYNSVLYDKSDMDVVYLELEGKITSTCSKDRCSSGHTT